jgi:hypothetical protein
LFALFPHVLPVGATGSVISALRLRRRKKGGVQFLGKIAERSGAQRSNFDRFQISTAFNYGSEN